MFVGSLALDKEIERWMSRLERGICTPNTYTNNILR